MASTRALYLARVDGILGVGQRVQITLEGCGGAQVGVLHVHGDDTLGAALPLLGRKC